MEEGIRVTIEDDDGSMGGSDFAALKRRNEALEAEAARARLENQHHRQRDAVRNQVDAALATIESEGRAAEAEYASAIEAGNFEATGAATRRIANVEAKSFAWKEYAAAAQRPVPVGDPFEDHLQKFTPRTADWMRNNRDWVTDPRKSSKLQGAHHMAVGDGLTPDTDEYFQYVEKTIGLRGGSGSRRDGSAIDPTDVRTHIANGGKQVFLTKGERERANDGSIVWNHGPNKGKPIGNSEYARRKAELHKQGAYSKLD